MDEVRLRKIIFQSSLAVYVLSLTQEAVCSSGDDCGRSIDYLIYGIFGILEGGSGWCWLANPLLFLAWRYYKFNILFPITLSFMALVLMLYFLTFEKYSNSVLAKTIESYTTGYWLWVLSATLFLLGNIFILSRKRFKQKHLE